MPVSYKIIIFVDDERPSVVHHIRAASVVIRPGKAGSAAHHQLVGAIDAGTAGADGSKHVVTAVSFMDVYPFEIGARHLLFFGAGFHGEAVIAHFNQVNAAEATPHEIVASVVFNEAWVDGVLYADGFAAEQRPVVGKRACRAAGCGYADAAGPFSAPYRHGVVQYILAIDVADVGSPKPAIRLKGWP